MPRTCQRLIFLSAALLMSVSSFSQEMSEEKQRPYSRLTLYPINIPYALFGRLEASAEIGVSYADRLLLGFHHYSKDWWYSGPAKGNGFEVQYRRELHLDPYVIHNAYPYWGAYYEMDWLKRKDPFDPENISMTRFGLLSGFSKDLSPHVKVDLFYGLGLNIYSIDDPDYIYGYDYNEVIINFKGGFQIGIRL